MDGLNDIKDDWDGAVKAQKDRLFNGFDNVLSPSGQVLNSGDYTGAGVDTTYIRADLCEPPMNVRASGAKKTDTGKRRFSLLPIQPLYDAIDVLEFGAKRYGDYNWQKGFEWTALYNAAQRHLHAWFEGEDDAEDSQLPHLAHAMVNMMFLLVFRFTHKEMDNRPSKERQ